MKRIISIIIIFSIATILPGEVPVPSVNRSPFGAQMVWPSDPNLEIVLDRMEEAGIQWTHFDLIWWGLCEQEKGTYDFINPETDVPEHQGWNVDRAVSLLRERNIEIFPTLCYGNELYDDNLGPHSEEAQEAFANYCYAAAKRYKDSIFYWEIWNEPNLDNFWPPKPNPEDYANLVKKAAKRIREANPQARIAAGATSHVDIGFLEQCFRHGMLEYVDIITVRPYRFGKPEDLNKELSDLRFCIGEYTNKEIEVWSGEWGYNTYVHQISERNHAKTLSRMMVNDLSQDMGLSIWFSTHAFPEHSGAKMDPEWGLLDYNYKPRPAFYAMKTVIERLPAPVNPATGPFQIQAVVPGYSQRIETFKHDESRFTVALWLETWPLGDSFDGVRSDVSLNVSSEYSFHAYDGLSGEPVNLELHRDDQTVSWKDFQFMDYPVFVDMRPDRSENPPERIKRPDPEDEKIPVSINSDLEWKNGGGATSYKVYFGNTDPPEFRSNRTEPFFDPGEMKLNEEYFWRIDPTNAAGTTKGETRRFRTTSSTPTPSPTPTPTLTPVPGEPHLHLTFDKKNDAVLQKGDVYTPDSTEEKAWSVTGIYAEIFDSDNVEIKNPEGKDSSGPGALFLDSGGKEECLNVELEAPYPMGDYTIEAVFCADSNNVPGNMVGIQNLLESWRPSGEYDSVNVSLRILGDGEPVGRPQHSGHLEFVVWESSGKEKRVVSKEPVKPETWNTVRAVFNYNETAPQYSYIALYLNGGFEGKEKFNAEGLEKGIGAILAPNFGSRKGKESARILLGGGASRLFLSNKDHRGLQGAIDEVKILNEAMEPE